MSDEKRFTQEDVDRIVQERLKREKAKEEREKVDVQAEVDAEIPDYKALYFSKLKQVKLLDAGVPMEKIDRVQKYITDGPPEEIDRQAKMLAEEAGVTNQTRPNEKQATGKWRPF